MLKASSDAEIKASLVSVNILLLSLCRVFEDAALLLPLTLDVLTLYHSDAGPRMRESSPECVAIACASLPHNKAFSTTTSFVRVRFTESLLISVTFSFKNDEKPTTPLAASSFTKGSKNLMRFLSYAEPEY
jgi:hypothetical protein